MKKKLFRMLLSLVLSFTTIGAAFAAPSQTMEVQAATDFSVIFDATYYLSKYPDLAAVYGNDPQKLYNHYRNVGVGEGRQPSAQFNPVYYISNYPDLVAIFGNSWGSYAKHFVDCGIAEGRVADRLLPGKSVANMAEIAQMKPQQELNWHSEPVTPLPDHYHDLTTTEEFQLALTQLTNAADKTLVFNPALVYPGTTVRTYCDNSTQVVCWKELVNGYVCSFAEVTIADGSQFRRKLNGDAFGTKPHVLGSVLSAQADAVVAANADFYLGRGIGTVVYDGTVYRFASSLDTCYITYDGKMLFSYAGQLKTMQDCQNFVAANNVNFAITFGPVIVDNGEQRHVSSYMLGEIDDKYCRAALGEIDDRHYLIMVMNQDYGHGVSDLHAVAPIMLSKNCQKAYTLDGGLTGAIYMDDVKFNRVNVREVSDIIYFATYGD